MEAHRESQSKGESAAGNGRWLAVWAAAALAAGAALRAWMLGQFFQANGDTLVYGNIARNLLAQGWYAATDASGATHSTLIRLPGYPLFLAGCFGVFGLDNYVAVAWVQIGLELAGCLLLADFARRIAPEGVKTAAGMATLWLAALCPFTAVYAATPLTEGPTLFLLALALWAAARFVERPGWGAALWFTAAVTGAALLRPDGALAAVALAPALLAGLRRGGMHARAQWRVALVCVLLALAPFAAWTWRNWRVFHLVQPLVPESATDPGQPVYPGWERWVRTWALDFNATYQVYWNVPGGALEMGDLPARAFDTAAERTDTAKLAAEYNANGYELTPALDAGFAGLARERIAAAPLRYYVWLPLGRVADMWLRPRVENLPIDLDWTVYEHHPEETVISWSYVALNGLYLLLGLAGLLLRPRMWGWMLAYMALRSVLLAVTVGSPEARYTLECFPMLFALGGVAIAWGWARVRGRVV